MIGSNFVIVLRSPVDIILNKSGTYCLSFTWVLQISFQDTQSTGTDDLNRSLYAHKKVEIYKPPKSF